MKQSLIKHIGLTWVSWVGKSTFAKEFKDIDHEYISLSAFVRQQTEIKLLEPNRENFRKVAAELRQTLWNGFLAKFAYEHIKVNEWKKFIIDWIRHTDEIKFLWNNLDITFIGIKLDDTEELITRILERKKSTDILTRESILLAIQSEWFSNSMNVNECLDLCSILIDNGASMKAYKRRIQKEKSHLVYKNY